MPKAEYIEYLRSNGASEEDIKTLSEGTGAVISIRAFDAMQTRLATEAKARQTAETERQAAVDQRAGYDKWFQEQLTPEWNKLQEASARAEGNRARAVAILKDLQRQGVVNETLLKDLDTPGATPPNAPPPSGGTPPAGGGNGNPDPRYMTREEILRLADQEGLAIARMANIAAEHAQLFPGSDLVNWEALRTRAITAKKSVEQLWLEEFKVPEARAARQKKIQDERDEKIRKEGYDKAAAELATKYGNPDTRVAVPSRSPFVVRPERVANGEVKQPWQIGSEDQLSGRRVENATRKMIERAS